MIRFTLSGTTILWRSWDGRYDDDPVIAKALAGAKTVRRGRGYQLAFEVTYEVAEVILNDLYDNLEAIEGESEIREWYLSGKADADKLRDLIIL